MFLLPLVLAMLIAGSVHADFKGAVAAYGRGDYKAAMAEFTKLANSGDTAAMNNLGMMYLHGRGSKQSYEAAREWWTKAAKQGNLDAMTNLGVMYELGQGVKPDSSVAAQWYARAAQFGLPAAQYNLAELYAKGQGVAQDNVQAYTLYSLAASKGVKDAAPARDALAAKMTPSQLALAKQKLAKLTGQ